MRLKGRIERLEMHKQDVLAEPFRIVVTTPMAFDLTKSTCTRTRLPSGLLSEIIHLHGMHKHFTGAEFESWVASFPIEDTRQ